MMEGLVQSTIRIVRCPACGRFVRAVVNNGRVKGWCTVQRRYVNTAIDEVVDRATTRAEKGVDEHEAVSDF
jgi:gamma-glutamyltranspeptidase